MQPPLQFSLLLLLLCQATNAMKHKIEMDFQTQNEITGVLSSEAILEEQEAEAETNEGSSSSSGEGVSTKIKTSVVMNTTTQHGGNCTIYEHYCYPTAHDLIEQVDGEVKDYMDCKGYCKEHKDCNYFTFLKHRGIASCFLLSGCNEQKPKCIPKHACMSGRKNCGIGSFCKKLEHHSTTEHSRWRCEDVNPYDERIPAGTPCHTWCPSWKNKEGKQITAKSSCMANGSWSPTVSFPGGELEFGPDKLPSPDDKDPPCHCQDLKLTYNPNDDPAGEFYCDDPLNMTAAALPARVETSNVCHFFCDRILIDIVECKEGVWAGRPDLGFYCSQWKPPVLVWDEEED